MRFALVLVTLVSLPAFADGLREKFASLTGLREGNYHLVQGYDAIGNIDDCQEGPLKVIQPEGTNSLSVILGADPIAVGVWESNGENEEGIVTSYTSNVKPNLVQATRKQAGRKFSRLDTYKIQVAGNEFTYKHRVFVNNALKHDWTCQLQRDR